MATFKERLRALRKERGWTQEDLAREIGVTRSAIANYEAPSARNVPEPGILKKIAECFGVSIDYLLGHTNDRRPYSPAPETMTLEDALRELLNAEHVMFHGLPLGELDEETKEDLLTIVQAVLEFRMKHKSRQEPPAKPPKKATAAAEESARAGRSALPLAAAV